YKKRDKKIVVVGSGPAGFFAAYALLESGFEVTILEQGPDVNARFKDIVSFERTGTLNERSNYAFGEGGAGTFSDGKLTSRTKSISKERVFVFDTYIEAGAPPEIAWMAHPHLGSDKLRKIVKYLRKKFIEKGGIFLFNTKVKSISLRQHKVNQGNQRVTEVETNKGKIAADYFVFAFGHSSYDTYRMLIGKGVPFRVKSFALGCRVEHRQELINRAQWNQVSLPGVKAAEYRLTFKEQGFLPVYSFCMCPGGKVVASTACKGTIIVNGMSNYRRNAPFANAGFVAGVDLRRLFNREIEALEVLDWLQELERKFFQFSHSYAAPANRISDVLAGKTAHSIAETSYPFGLAAADLALFFPRQVYLSLKASLHYFCKKIKGFEEGIMLGLESKTSS
ncbi:MAG: FAD-dependent oxidoreductase, partial [bacterium]|nr:FAD-dependent oxidoreductase [bacterium]